MFVKICGITRPEDAQSAVRCGADALGFIFWASSPRFIDVEPAQAIIATLPPRVASVGVFVNQPIDEVNQIARRAGVSMVQLHGDETPEYAAAVERPVIKAFALERGRPAATWPDATMWLVDAHDPERRGGTGRRADWAAAAQIAAERRILLAGGLTPANVAVAIAQVRPYGIDISSGVELRPGIKDPALIAALFEAVHVTSHH